MITITPTNARPNHGAHMAGRESDAGPGARVH